MIKLLLILSFLPFATKRLARYLHIYQQDEYDSRRFVNWLLTSHSYDKKASIGVILASLCIFWAPHILIVTGAYVLLGLLFLFLAWHEDNPLKAAKKPLVLTERAKRILMVAAFIELAVLFLSLQFFFSVWILAIQFIPLALVGANIFLSPFEKSVKANLRAEAVHKLNQLNPLIIGITGSYGKTSVKHILGHILEFHGPTLFTPGSVNTEMGIVRIIREQLGPQHKYFIVEMGAYAIGSIARLCALTPPKLSIITAIGQAHYERFKTLEDTAKAKFEIAEAAINQGGKVIIHESVLNVATAASFHQANSDKFIVCGLQADIRVLTTDQTSTGLNLTLQHKGKDYNIATPLFGLQHAGNIALAFAAAAELGMDPAHIVIALQSTPQIKHRLEVKNFGDHTLIDDAYNSNPAGFAAALDILDLLGKNTRRILVTPGMIEMGEEHDAAHSRLGEMAVSKADIVIAVKPERIPTFCHAFEARKTNNQILLNFGTFHEAQDWLIAHRKPGDVILLENDLPDLYERYFAS